MTVIDTLKELVTDEGSIFMPALRHSRELPLTDRDRELGITVKTKDTSIMKEFAFRLHLGSRIICRCNLRVLSHL